MSSASSQLCTAPAPCSAGLLTGCRAGLQTRADHIGPVLQFRADRVRAGLQSRRTPQTKPRALAPAGSSFPILITSLLLSLCSIPLSATTLRVCSDPNNLPYSNQQQQGFENRIASLIASDLNEKVEYFWFPQRSKFFQSTLDRGVCDVVMGVPAGLAEAASTAPYYRSTYVFITRRSSRLNIRSFDDPRLRTLRIGVHILGDQNDNLPPVNALLSRGIVRNVTGYSIFGNLYEKDPPADVIRALEQKKIDVAIVWGPLGGYFSRHSSVPLTVTPVSADPKNPALPFQFDIGIGVRPGNTALRQALDRELQRRHDDIVQILRDYGIPQLALPLESAGCPMSPMLGHGIEECPMSPVLGHGTGGCPTSPVLGRGIGGTE